LSIRTRRALFGSLHREMDRLFDDFARNLDVRPARTGLAYSDSKDGRDRETDNEIEITVEMPGLERKDVDITIEDEVLTIRGEKVERSEGNGA
jgi:HSP20 family protein